MIETAQATSKARFQTDRVLELLENVERVVRGKPEVVRLAAVALLGRGHLLLEDVPGVGKTTLARSIARSIQGSFRRIQFTSDLLPLDLLGVSIFEPTRREFEFRRGPIFANVVLADELNRAMPKTQGALLEAMSEGSVSIDGVTHPLPDPFIVLATQNPAEYHGTFPLPESQLDRFMMRLPLGYPPHEAERAIVKARPGVELADELRPVLTTEEVRALTAEVERVHASEAIVDYVLALAEATRHNRGFRLGVSPRGAQAHYRAAKALAYIRGRAFVLPDDVKEFAIPVLAHRVLVTEAETGLGSMAAQEAAIERLVLEVRVPS